MLRPHNTVLTTLIVYNSDEEVNRRQVVVVLVNILNPKYDFNYTTAGYIFPSNWKDILRSEFFDFAEEDGWDNDVYIDYEDGLGKFAETYLPCKENGTDIRIPRWYIPTF